MALIGPACGLGSKGSYADGCDQGDQRHEHRVLDEVLALIITNERNEQLLHDFSSPCDGDCVRRWESGPDLPPHVPHGRVALTSTVAEVTTQAGHPGRLTCAGTRPRRASYLELSTQRGCN